MPLNAVQTYAAKNAGAVLEPWSYEPTAIGATEVDVTVTHCGICHTDLHLINNDLGVSSYPLVPGHEIVGVVSAVGSEVRDHRPGQRVGVGWQRGSCAVCEWCLDQKENLCAQSRPTCLAGFGGFAHSVRSEAHFAVPIPDGLHSASAAPMLCAGITVYRPLKRYVKSGYRVGVIGIGGLGHLAIQFARAMGAEVYAISTSEEKRDEAIQFGAHRFVVSRGSAPFAGKLDLVLCTATGDLDWPSWMNALRPTGTFCLLGASPGPVSLPVLPMIFGEFSFTASVVGSPARIAEMLQFAADHKINTAVETFPLNQVNLALDKLRKNEARYRMVLTT
jgi:uncharacterized zinc-type alcohol dehydrogenase-like protein